MKLATLVRHFFDDVLLYLAKGGFLKAVAKLSGATALGQIVTVLASLVLTHLYTPREFGFLAVFTALLSQLMVFTSLRYEWAIPPAKDDEVAFDLSLLSLLLVLVVTTGTTIAVGLGAVQIAAWVNFPTIAQHLYLLPIAIFFVGCYQILNYWGLRKKEFTLLAKSQIAKSLWTSLTQIILGLLTTGPIGLLVGAVVNQVAGTSALVMLFWQDFRKRRQRFSLHRLVKAGKDHANFAGLCITSSFFNYAAMSSPTLLLAYFYTPEVVGSFSLAQRFSAIPAVFISNAISQVYFANACQLVHENPQELKQLYQRTTLLLFSIATVTSTCFLISPWIVPRVLGEQWSQTGMMMLYMAPMLLVTIAVSPLTMLEWLEKNIEILIWHIVRLVLIVAGFYFAKSQNLSAVSSIGIFSLITAVMYIVLLWLNRFAMNELIQKQKLASLPKPNV
jgi:O-antigen/teichoic acid export membrane protein